MSAVLRRLRSRLTWHGECVCGWDYTDATRTTCRGPRDCPNSVRPARRLTFLMNKEK